MSTTSISDRSHTFPDGHTMHSSLRLPFAVRVSGRTRNYGTLAAARQAGDPGAAIFFDVAKGHGYLIEKV